jgi:1-deoxy-D-xylulose-5-phosphate reductoisomerase
MRSVSVFGATGSIGESTFGLLMDAGGPAAFRCVALSGGRNVGRLAAQARALGAEVAVTAFPECLEDLRDALAGSMTEAAAGPAALVEAAARPADWTMSAIVGAAGLAPGHAALRRGGTLALANKESLVCAGPLILAAARDGGAQILPVDSEHSAVFQALAGQSSDSVERIVITASGGALRDWPAERLASATVADVSTHPNWSMGLRITIDSASMFNKAMELIEAREFFGVQPDAIEAVIHPESLIHAIVGFRDGGMLAHLGPHDMRHAIGYALNWPDRAHLPVDRLDLAAIGQLTFRPADPERYPALPLARAVMERGGIAGAVFTAAKEAALDAFLAGAIGFTRMAGVVEETLARYDAGAGLGCAPNSLDNVILADAEARRLAGGVIATAAGRT